MGPVKRLIFWLTIGAFIFSAISLIVSFLPDKEEKEQIEQIPYVNLIPFGWRQIKDISADYGIKARFIIENYGDQPIKGLHILDEYYILVTLKTDDLPNIQALLSKQSENLDINKNKAISLYKNRKIETYKKVKNIFEKEYKANMESKYLQELLLKKNIQALVYNQPKQYYFEPRILKPKRRYSYEYGRSTSIETIESDILDKGTHILIIVSILEYYLQDKKYSSFLISRSEYGRNTSIRTQNYLYYPLIEYKEWYKEMKK